MLFFLNNQSSRAGAPNENYARELLELHTLGRAAYLGAARTRGRAARSAGGPARRLCRCRCLGGRAGPSPAGRWQRTSRSMAAGGCRDTGEFAFVGGLARPVPEALPRPGLDPFAGAMVHGRAVLDALAEHPATARFVCTNWSAGWSGSRCRHAMRPRRAAPSAPAARRRTRSPTWCAPSWRGPEVADPELGRMRRPLDAVAAAARAYGCRSTPTPALFGQMAAAGQAPLRLAPAGRAAAGRHAIHGASALRTRWDCCGAGPQQPAAPGRRRSMPNGRAAGGEVTGGWPRRRSGPPASRWARRSPGSGPRPAAPERPVRPRWRSWPAGCWPRRPSSGSGPMTRRRRRPPCPPC